MHSAHKRSAAAAWQPQRGMGKLRARIKQLIDPAGGSAAPASLDRGVKARFPKARPPLSPEPVAKIDSTEKRMTDSNMMPVIGLGTLCLTSQTLKQMGFKKSSMPFDWIFSSPEMVEHAIANDFREF